jgi:hypothetical protein
MVFEGSMENYKGYNKLSIDEKMEENIRDFMSNYGHDEIKKLKK